MGMFPPAPFLPTIQRGCHLQPARRSPLPSSHSAPGLLSPVHPLQPQQETPTCPSGTLQGRKESPPAWGDHRVLCGQVGIEYPTDREVELGSSAQAFDSKGGPWLLLPGLGATAGVRLHNMPPRGCLPCLRSEGHGYQTQDVPDQKEGPSSL